jgi:hypothetical protein
MQLRSDKKFFRRRSTSFIFLSFSGLIVIITCAYYGFKVSGTGGALFGAFFGLTICGC